MTILFWGHREDKFEETNVTLIQIENWSFLKTTSQRISLFCFNSDIFKRPKISAGCGRQYLGVYLVVHCYVQFLKKTGPDGVSGVRWRELLQGLGKRRC